MQVNIRLLDNITMQVCQQVIEKNIKQTIENNLPVSVSCLCVKIESRSVTATCVINVYRK